MALPHHVTLLRGNHEDPVTNRQYGFDLEIERKYSMALFDTIKQVFAMLPLCALVQSTCFVVHAGMVRDDPKVTGMEMRVEKRVGNNPQGASGQDETNSMSRGHQEHARSHSHPPSSHPRHPRLSRQDPGSLMTIDSLNAIDRKKYVSLQQKRIGKDQGLDAIMDLVWSDPDWSLRQASESWKLNKKRGAEHCPPARHCSSP